MLSLNNIDLQFGTRFIFRDLNLSIQDGQKVGLAGKNGTGKTSLFSIVTGKLAPDVGDVSIIKGTRTSYLQQESHDLDQIAIEYVIAGDQQLHTINQHIQAAEESEDHMKLAELYNELSEIDGYSANARASEILNGLGFSQEEMQQSLQSFSGGWRMRLSLARCLFAPADLMLLDEPTNHLDLEAIFWLEKWLKKYSGCLLLVSHDREFMDDIISHVAVINDQQCQFYPGNYSMYEKRRAEQLALQQSMHEKQQRKRDHMQSFVDRFKAKASKAKQAQSRMKALEKMEVIAAAHVDSPFNFEFKPAPPAGNPLVHMEKVDLNYEDYDLFKQLDYSIHNDERLGLLGINGVGKSTFLKMIARELPVSGGVIEYNPKLKIGYFAQHQLEYLRLDENSLWHLGQIAPGVEELQLRKFLGRFGFGGDMVKSNVGNFSGGEKSRLSLALIVWQQPNLLILDEPTNHLDIEMREALIMALQEFSGSMIIVSHDRHLMRCVVDSYLLLDGGRIRHFDGDLEDYEILVEGQRRAAASQQKKAAVKVKQEKKNQQTEQLEAKISKHAASIAEIEKQLADATLYLDENKDQLKTLTDEDAKLKQELEAFEAEWLNTSSS